MEMCGGRVFATKEDVISAWLRENNPDHHEVKPWGEGIKLMWNYNEYGQPVRAAKPVEVIGWTKHPEDQ